MLAPTLAHCSLSQPSKEHHVLHLRLSDVKTAFYYIQEDAGTRSQPAAARPHRGSCAQVLMSWLTHTAKYQSVHVCSESLLPPVVQSRPHANPAALCVSSQQLPPALNLKCEEWILHFKQISIFTWNQTTNRRSTPILSVPFTARGSRSATGKQKSTNMNFYGSCLRTRIYCLFRRYLTSLYIFSWILREGLKACRLWDDNKKNVSWVLKERLCCGHCIFLSLL